MKFSTDPYKMFTGFPVQLYGFTLQSAWTRNDEESSEGDGSPYMLGIFSKCLTGADKWLSAAGDKTTTRKRNHPPK